MPTKVIFERNKILKGFELVADAVAGTLGPKGKNVYLDDAVQPKITNDGVSIANRIDLEDKEENLGAKIVKNACSQTLDDAGDGTTTTAVLLKAIVKEALVRPENPIELRESLLKTVPQIVKEIKKQAKKIDKKSIKKVALISSQDEELAENISVLIEALGADASITIEDSYEGTTTHEIAEGYEAHVGFMDTRFSNQTNKAKCVMKDAYVLVCETKLSAISDIAPLWEQFAKAGISECVIVCEDIDPSILGTFLINKATGRFQSVVIRATGDALKDIEAAVGATRVSPTTGVTFQNVTLDHLGRAKRVECTAKETRFVATNPGRASLHADWLLKEAEQEHNMFIKERLLKRVSQLKGGIGILKVGSPDFNREYLKDKADDAVKAVKAALQEGVVEGGGMCLYRIATEIKPKTAGEEIVKKALRAPLKTIIENAGMDYADIVRNMPDAQGYDALKNTYVSMIDAGIIDPAKVERASVENAISNAANFITAYASVVECEAKK